MQNKFYKQFCWSAIAFTGFTVNPFVFAENNPKSQANSSEDPYAWMEEVQGARPLEWVQNESTATQKDFETRDGFAERLEQAKKILTAPDRIPSIFFESGKLLNYWQDAQHKQGILRTISVADFNARNEGAWSTFLDLDILSKDSGAEYVFKGINCLPSNPDLCLVALSNGGKDATEIRELNIKTKKFVEGGFFVPESKTTFAWLDENRIVLATDFGEGSLTLSKYPRIAKVWKRGTPLNSAVIVVEGKEEDMGLFVSAFDIKSQSGVVIERRPSFFESEIHTWLSSEKSAKKLPIPLAANLETVFGEDAVVMLRKKWSSQNRVFENGSLVAVNLISGKISEIFKPTKSLAYHTSAPTKDALVVGLLDNIQSTVRLYRYENSKWTHKTVSTESGLSTSVATSNHLGNEFYLLTEGFLQSPSLLSGDAKTNATKLVQKMPSRFQEDQFITEQMFAKSADGTKVPYFVIRAKSKPGEKQNPKPTLLYGYGGFEIPLTPSYIPVQGKLWLEKGGIYVVANIRGGGEFGPAWHQAALLKNRQRAYDDFIAVADDLVSKKLTSADQLGIMGGSNGGLLVGAVTMQRPSLFKAVVCLVPLLDMLRYVDLPPGDSWKAEYGDPKDPVMRKVIARYSPYQNVKPGTKYPRIFFYTSSLDDRVHPGHARKMAHKLQDLGNPVFYYENSKGGHAGSSNLDQRSLQAAMTYTYLHEQLNGRP